MDGCTEAMEPRSTRRTLLRGAGAACGSLAVAGCSRVLGDSGGVSAVGLTVQNELPGEHTTRVEVRRDGGTVFEETFDVPTDGAAARAASWSTRPATYEVLVAVSGPDFDGDIVAATLGAPTSDRDAECHALSVMTSSNAPGNASVGTIPASWVDLACE